MSKKQRKRIKDLRQSLKWHKSQVARLRGLLGAKPGELIFGTEPSNLVIGGFTTLTEADLVARRTAGKPTFANWLDGQTPEGPQLIALRERVQQILRDAQLPEAVQSAVPGESQLGWWASECRCWPHTAESYVAVYYQDSPQVDVRAVLQTTYSPLLTEAGLAHEVNTPWYPGGERFPRIQVFLPSEPVS